MKATLSIPTQGAETSERLRCLRPVLQEWIALNLRMGREWNTVGDAPWWYNERALVSLFAGAIWRSGGDAFEEFSFEKRRAKEISGGRIDLWLALGPREFLAEAKQCWVHSHDRRKSIRCVREAMDRARADANCCIPDGRPRLAMVFATALVPVGIEDQLESEIQNLCALVKAPALKADAAAWIFPQLEEPLKSSDGFFLPGILLWIRKIR